MYIERVGYLGSKLYRLGWRSAVNRNLTPPQHHLLNIFLYYRRGFASGSDWIKDCHVEKTLQLGGAENFFESHDKQPN